MVETPGNRGGIGPLGAGSSKSVSGISAWFVREVLPLEAVLIQFLHHNWRNPSEGPDLLHDVYVRTYEAAGKEIPDNAKAFVFATARNLIIDRVRRERIVPIEIMSDMESLGIAVDEPDADRRVIARAELRRLEVALERLRPRFREAFVLRQIEGLSRREIATRMGVSEETVKQYLADGICALADMLYGEAADLRRQK
jgi:RNA polymerase sigma-70 factor (ECF subfamily)